MRAYGEGMRRTAEKRVAQGGEGLNERELARHVERIGPCAIPTEGGSWSWERRSLGWDLVYLLGIFEIWLGC